MKNSKWYLSTVHRLLVQTQPLYNAVKIVDGKAKEAPFDPTPHRHIAERRVATLNNQDALAAVAVRKAAQ